MQKQTNPEPLGLSIAKLVLVVAVIVTFGALLGVVGYLTKKSKPIQPPQKLEVNAIEISADKKSILNAETKGVIFTISEAKKYLYEAGYEYNPDAFLNNTNQTTNAKYGGDCFSDASFKISAYDRIVFSTGCLSGDIQQPWIGIYNFPYKSKTDIEQVPRIYFLAGDNGKKFIWSKEGFYITYEVYSDSEELVKTKEIDIYGKIIYEKIIKTKDETVDWKTFTNKRNGFEIKYPKDWEVTKNIFSIEPSLVFCPSVLAIDSDPEVVCKLKTGATKPQYEEGMIYLLTYDSDPKPNNPKYHYLGSATGKYYYLYSEGNESIVNQILSTFRFIE